MSHLFKHEERIYDLTIVLKDEFGEFAKIRDELLEQLRYADRWADEERDDMDRRGDDYWGDFTEDELDEIKFEAWSLFADLHTCNFVIDYSFDPVLGEFDELTVSVEKYNEILYKAIEYIERELEQRSYADSIFGEFNAL